MGHIVDLPLASLRANETYQPRMDGLDRDHLERLRSSDLETWPPLLVVPNDIGSYDVIDGFHRLCVAQERGLAVLKCEVEAAAGYFDAVLANQQHGLPLARRDRKRFARWLHAEWPESSLRQLGEFCGLDPKTVKRALEEGEEGIERQEHAEGEEFPRQRSPHSPRTRTPHEAPVAKLVRLLCSETIVTYFNALPSREEGADAILAEIATYDEASQPLIAQNVMLISQTLMEGANYFLT